MKNIMECLNFIQTNLKAPKNLNNDYSNYKYRNLEGIMEGLKPLLVKTKCFLTCSDEIVMVGDRYYIKSTATLTSSVLDDANMSVTAWARETHQRKGMDEPQITGTASSYARKYAVCGLFAIDDGQDVDGMDNTKIGQYYATDLEKKEYQKFLKHKIFNEKGKDGKPLRTCLNNKWKNFTTQDEVIKCLKWMEQKVFDSDNQSKSKEKAKNENR